MADDIPCLSCPGCIFKKRADYWEHTKTKWHAFNTDSKLMGRPPLSLEDYEIKMGIAQKPKEEAEAPKEPAAATPAQPVIDPNVATVCIMFDLPKEKWSRKFTIAKGSTILMLKKIMIKPESPPEDLVSFSLKKGMIRAPNFETIDGDDTFDFHYCGPEEGQRFYDRDQERMDRIEQEAREREEEEQRRKEEKKRQEEEKQRLKEEEAKRQEEEIARRQAEEKQQQEEAERRKEDEQRWIQEETRRWEEQRQEEIRQQDAKRREQKRALEEAAKRREEERRAAEEAAKRQREEQLRREEEEKRAAEEAAKRQREEQLRREEEEKKRAAEEAAKRQREEQLRREEEEKRAAEEAAKRQQEEQLRREEEAKRSAEEAARRQEAAKEVGESLTVVIYIDRALDFKTTVEIKAGTKARVIKEKLAEEDPTGSMTADDFGLVEPIFQRVLADDEVITKGLTELEVFTSG